MAAGALCGAASGGDRDNYTRPVSLVHTGFVAC